MSSVMTSLFNSYSVIMIIINTPLIVEIIRVVSNGRTFMYVQKYGMVSIRTRVSRRDTDNSEFRKINFSLSNIFVNDT